MYTLGSLIPRLLPAFQHRTLKSIENLGGAWGQDSLVPRGSGGGERERLVHTVYACA